MYEMYLKTEIGYCGLKAMGDRKELFFYKVAYIYIFVLVRCHSLLLGLWKMECLFFFYSFPILFEMDLICQRNGTPKLKLEALN